MIKPKKSNKHFKYIKICLIKRDYRKSSKYHLKLTNLLKEIIIGTMLGDLTAEKKNKNSNTRLHFKQSIKNGIYINHLFNLFQNFCGSSPILLSYFDKRPNKMKKYYSKKFVTLSLPCFNKYRELFYNTEGKKIIPKNIEFLLTPISLAYWIMDDGYKRGNGLYISTESFSLKEN